MVWADFTVPEVIHIITQALLQNLICLHLLSGIVCTYQAMQLCLCYNHYMYNMLGSLGDTLQNFLKNKYAEIDFEKIPTNKCLM